MDAIFLKSNSDNDSYIDDFTVNFLLAVLMILLSIVFLLATHLSFMN